MGFLDRIFKKGAKRDERSPDVSEDVAELDLEGLESRVADLGVQGDEGSDESSGVILESARSSIARIKKITLSIGKTPCHGGVHERFRKIITTSKPVFVKGVVDAAESVEKLESSGRADLAHALEVFLADLSRMLTGPGRYFPLAYPDEVNELKKESNVLIDCLKELGEGVEVDETGDLRKGIASVREKRDALNSLRTEVARLEETLAAQEKELASLECELEALEGSGEFRELRDMEDKLTEVREKTGELENRAYNLLTPMKRPFKKFRKELLAQKSTGISTDLLASYVKDPLEVFYANEPGVLAELFRQVTDAVESGSLELSGSEKEKTLSRIGNLINSDLEGIKSSLTTLRDEEKNIVSLIEGSNLHGKRRDLTNEIDRSKRELAFTGSEIESVKKKDAKILQEIDAELKGLEEEFLRVAGKRIKLSL